DGPGKDDFFGMSTCLPWSLAWDPNGQRLAAVVRFKFEKRRARSGSSAAPNGVEVWDRSTRARTAWLGWGYSERVVLSFSPDAQRRAVAEAVIREFSIYDLVMSNAIGKLTAIGKLPEKNASHVAWSGDGKHIVARHVETDELGRRLAHGDVAVYDA